MGNRIQVLRVVSRREGFRRAGFTFGKEPVDLTRDDLENLGGEKIKSIVNDPSLVCVEAEIDVPDEADAESAPKPAASAPAKTGKK